MPRLHLFRFGYSRPEDLRRVERHPHEDLAESWSSRSRSLGVRCLADGLRFADAFVQRLFGPSAYSWQRLNFAHWIESDPGLVEQALSDNIAILESLSDVSMVAQAMADPSSTSLGSSRSTLPGDARPRSPMTTSVSLPAEPAAPGLDALRAANREFARRYPGEGGGRQPVHTVYGGGHLFRADTAAKLGAVAREGARRVRLGEHGVRQRRGDPGEPRQNGL